jgi:hypothetical protein
MRAAWISSRGYVRREFQAADACGVDLKRALPAADPQGMSSLLGTDIEEDLILLDARLKQLRNEYEQYFMGSRKREPQLLRGEVQKIVTYYANVPIRNTGHRFKFNNLRARYFSFRRHWDDIQRKIEDGTYDKHRFQAELHERERGLLEEEAPKPAKRGGEPAKKAGDELGQLYDAWIEARAATGQPTAGLTREKLAAQLEQQTKTIRERFGAGEVRFRVVVEDGKAKLKASPVGGTGKPKAR